MDFSATPGVALEQLPLEPLAPEQPAAARPQAPTMDPLTASFERGLAELGTIPGFTPAFLSARRIIWRNIGLSADGPARRRKVLTELAAEVKAEREKQAGLEEVPFAEEEGAAAQ